MEGGRVSGLHPHLIHAVFDWSRAMDACALVSRHFHDLAVGKPSPKPTAKKSSQEDLRDVLPAGARAARDGRDVEPAGTCPYGHPAGAAKDGLCPSRAERRAGSPPPLPWPARLRHPAAPRWRPYASATTLGRPRPASRVPPASRGGRPSWRARARERTTCRPRLRADRVRIPRRLGLLRVVRVPSPPRTEASRPAVRRSWNAHFRTRLARRLSPWRIHGPRCSQNSRIDHNP